MNFEDKLQVQIKVYDVGYVQVGDRFFDMNDNGEPNFEVEHENAGGGYDEDGNPVKIDPLLEAQINTSGQIIQDGKVVATIQVTDFEDYNYLEHYGENYYQPVEGAETKEPLAKVYSGYLETSNVSAVTEMVNMITAGLTSLVRDILFTQILLMSFVKKKI